MSNTTPAPLMDPIRYGFEFPDFQPFSARAGIGYQDLLETMRYYLERKLSPYVATLPSGLQSQLDGAIAEITQSVDTALQQEDVRFGQTLDEIIAGANVQLNDGTILSVLKANGPSARYLGAGLRMQGAGFDSTGATDSSAAINAFLAAAAPGATVIVPEGVIYAASSRITIPNRIRLTGAGELRWTGAEDAMFAVRADGAHLDGLYLTNPNAAPISGIYIYANECTITANRIVGFRDGICVSELGEYYGNIIAYNHVIDIIGSGTGPTNADWNSGESNGDGIVSWGSDTIIVGNRVSAKAGKDARIGIHVEAISRYANAGEDPDSGATVVGNIISGPFRRAITSEGVHEAVIANNRIRGYTFWGINVVGYNRNVVVEGNIIKKTSPHANPTQSVHTGILVYCIQYAQDNIKVRNNDIYIGAGGYMDNGITVNNDPSVNTLGIQHSEISGNSVTDDSNTLGDGIHVSPGSDSLEITDNRIYRFGAAGVRVAGPGTRVTVSRNKLYGRGTASGVLGISLEGGAVDAEVDHNTVRDMETAIRAYFRGEMLSISGNKIRNGTNGIDLYGAQNSLAAMLRGNQFYNVGSSLINAPTGVTLT